MPVIKVKLDRLSQLVETVSTEDLIDLLFRLKVEAEVVQDKEEGLDYVEMEVNPDRPDMFVGEGVARAVRGLIGAELGYKRPPVIESDVRVVAERVPQRPYIAVAVVNNVNVDDDFMRELIQFQEKLDETLGRRRRRVAIGLHDYDKVAELAEGEVVVRYANRPVEEVSFEPLPIEREGGGRIESGGEVRASELLAMVAREASPEYKAYASLALRDGEHPFLLVGDKIISMPPLINSAYTKVEPGTSHVLVDVTGTDPIAVHKVLDIIVSNLAERPGAIVGSVRVSAPGQEEVHPRLETVSMDLAVAEVERVLGVRLEADEVESLLLRARYQAEALKAELIEVEVPPFRVDVLGTVDLIEDIAMMYGYDKLEPRYAPPPGIRGSISLETRLARKVRVLSIGLGFTEVLQLVLTDPDTLEALGVAGEAVRVANAKQREYSILRPTLAATLLRVLAASQHAEKPVKVFEVGEVVRFTGDGVEEDLRLGLAILDVEVGFEDVQAPLYALLRALGVGFSVRAFKSPMFLEGRAAVLSIGWVGDFAWLGEVNPRALEDLGIRYPVALAEVSLRRLAEAMAGERGGS